jgi:hypothetical protein
MKSKNPASWSNVKTRLGPLDRAGLIGIIRDLYDASSANRRFLHARFVPTSATLDEYRDLVKAAVFPDPFSQRPIRLRDAAAAITDYKRSTGDLAGVVDLLLTFAEAGTEQAADLGYGDDAYFGTLERKVDDAVSMLEALSAEDRVESEARLIRLGQYESRIGWGYGDFLAEVANRLRARRPSRPVQQTRGLTSEWSRRRRRDARATHSQR